MTGLDRRSVLAGAGLSLVSGILSAQERLQGVAPSYGHRPLSDVPNAQAIGRRYWMPGLDDGYVPQGLTVMEDTILVAAYRSMDPKQDDGPSRIFCIGRSDGALRETFDLPATYGHPGGLAACGSTLFVANSGRLLAIDLSRPVRETPPVIAERLVDKAMGPSFLAYGRDALWFGPFRRQGQPVLHAVPLSRILDTSGDRIGPADALRTRPLPLLAQGATFDRGGALWISASAGNRPGLLYKIDAVTGAVLATFEAPGGIEDLGCAPDGRLWAVSEAGSQRWNRWDTFYPLVFEIDPDRLVARA